MHEDNVTISWQKSLYVTSIGMKIEDLQEYLRYHNSPFSDIDSTIDYANWCVNRGFKTYIYPCKDEEIKIKILLKILCWLGVIVGKLSNQVVRRCPNYA